MALKVWDRDRVISAAQAWHAANGRSPRGNEWPATGCPSASTVVRNFGRWDAMLSAAGLPPPPRREVRWTRRRIAQALRMWAREHGRAPRGEDFAPSPPGYPHRVTVVGAYGTFARALEVAGVGA
jgi:Homing endonuclease associated repeat